MKERTCWTRDEESTILALLHDVVEDHTDEYPFERLEAEGFGDDDKDRERLEKYRRSIALLKGADGELAPLQKELASQAEMS